MENAGRGTAELLQALGIHGPVVIACGKGNNGGDGLVIARHLANCGIDVLILLFAHPADLSPDAAVQWNIVQKMGLPAQIWAEQNLDDLRLTATFAGADWIVDALFGTGLTGPVRAPLDRVIERINSSSGAYPGRRYSLGPRLRHRRTARPLHPCGAYRDFRSQQGGFSEPGSRRMDRIDSHRRYRNQRSSRVKKAASGIRTLDFRFTKAALYH